MLLINKHCFFFTLFQMLDEMLEKLEDQEDFSVSNN